MLKCESSLSDSLWLSLALYCSLDLLPMPSLASKTLAWFGTSFLSSSIYGSLYPGIFPVIGTTCQRMYAVLGNLYLIPQLKLDSGTKTFEMIYFDLLRSILICSDLLRSHHLHPTH